MKKIIAVLLVLLTVLLCGCSIGDQKIRLGSAGVGGIYHETATSLKQLADSQGKLDIEVKTTAGSAANVRLLSQGYIDAAIAQSDIVNDAYNGENSFSSSKSYKGYGAVAGLFTEACHIIVREDSNIKSIDDLLGKTVSIGEKESGTELNANQILSVYGFTSKMINKTNLDYAQAAKKLSAGEIDAFFCTVGINATVIQELSKQCNIRLLSIDKEKADKLKAAYSYIDCTISKDIYSGQENDITSVGVKALLVASNKLSEEQVQALTELVFNNAKELQLTVSANIEINEHDAVQGIKIPFHKGAARYYSEKGIKVKTE